MMSWKDIRGWCDFEDVYAQAVAEAVDGDTLVEVGVAYGKSLAMLAEKVIASGKYLHIVAVDPWPEDWATGEDAAFNASHGGFYQAFYASLDQHAPETWDASIALMPNCGPEAAEIYRGWTPPEQPSFVFVDGLHDYESVLADIKAWLPLVKPGGLIAGHDHTASYPGVERAVREMFGDRYEVRGSSWIVRVPS